MSHSFAMDRRAEAEALQALARDETRQSRSELARSVAGLFERAEVNLGAGERRIAFDILEKLILNVEIAIRRDIAATLAHQPDAPRDLILALANDEIGIAFPVLVKSGVLDDTDLITIVRARSVDHWTAIAGRPALSAHVSATLVATNSERTIVALLRNKTASIAPKTIEHLVERSHEVESYRAPLLDRDDLGPDLALRMFFWVSTVLRDRIVDKFKIDEKIVEDLVGQVVMNEVKHVAEDKRSRLEISAELKTLMKREGCLTADMLMVALREGEVPLFVTMFARMTALGEHLIGRMLFEQDGKGLAVACRSAGVGRIAFTSIFALAQKMRAADTSVIHRHLPAILAFYESFPREAADEVLGHWRKGSEYAGAIRTVEYRLRRYGR